ncbi:MAG: LysE family transporter [Saprospiraceae bacterium]|nr:LysE family transporter [Saprospiraceae bacterium]
MSALWQGMLLGLSMSLLIGPVVFLFLQTGIERGFRAGAMAGLGVWMSDLLYVAGFYFGVSYIIKIIHWSGFKTWAGLLGGILLIGIGIHSIISRPPHIHSENRIPTSGASYFKLWAKGFFINTLNPFAAFFWLGVISTVSGSYIQKPLHSIYFFSGVLGIIVITDLLKVLLAKRIKPWLNTSHIMQMRRLSGIAMIALGIMLFVRAIWW